MFFLKQNTITTQIYSSKSHVCVPQEEDRAICQTSFLCLVFSHDHIYHGILVITCACFSSKLLLLEVFIYTYKCVLRSQESSMKETNLAFMVHDHDTTSYASTQLFIWFSYLTRYFHWVYIPRYHFWVKTQISYYL